ncbi:thioesterase family protein [Algiphilus sp. NNCM1]|jgi:acyl-CoA thioesterase|nr:thioesterase family protein [Algiphilus acroporae]
MTSLAQTLSALAPGVPCPIPANWLQGRTAYGGLSAAIALHLVLQEAPEGLPPLKAAQVSFVGPVSNSARFNSEILRRGKSVTQIGVDARVGDALAMRTSFIFGAQRTSKIRHVRTLRPDVQEPAAYLSLPSTAVMPGHFPNFDVRFVGDNLPISGSAVPELLAWVRLKDARGVRPEVALLALGDCLPPASMACFPEPAPISSMTWSVDFPQPAQSSNWYLQRSSSLAAADGYSLQLMEVWDEHGNLVLLGTQTVAIFT